MVDTSSPKALKAEAVSEIFGMIYMTFNLQEVEYVCLCMCNVLGKDLRFRIPG